MNRPKKTTFLNIRLTTEQKEKIQNEAQKNGVTLSNYILSTALIGKPKFR